MELQHSLWMINEYQPISNKIESLEAICVNESNKRSSYVSNVDDSNMKFFSNSTKYFLNRTLQSKYYFKS